MPRDKILILFSAYQPELGNTAGLFRAGNSKIKAGRLNAGMPQHIGQAGNNPMDLIKYGGKQMAQVMGKHLRGVYIRIFA